MADSFYLYAAFPQNDETNRQRVLHAFDFLLGRLIEDSDKKEKEVDETDDKDFVRTVRGKMLFESKRLDFGENSEDFLEWLRTYDSYRSGLRMKRISEIRELKQLFVDIEPSHVPDEVLKKTHDIFRGLVTAAALELYAITARHHKDAGQVMQEVLIYSSAVRAIGDTEERTLDDVYPFDG